jgi:RepB DNA-primase from phage plasmid/CHC2 zinc finger
MSATTWDMRGAQAATKNVLGLAPQQQARLFLRALALPAPDGALIELRYKRRDGGGMLQHWTPCTDAPSAAAVAVDVGRHADTYAGVARRMQREGGKDAVPAVRWLWADCDAPQATQALEAFDPPAPMVVRSSPGKGHAYWPLREWLGADDAERALRRLAHALGADSACAERARILRVPGTLNHKHGTPEPVELIRFEPPARSFTVADVVGGLPDPEPERDTPVAVGRPAGMDGTVADVLRGIPAEAYVPALIGQEAIRGYVRCPFHSGGQERTPSLFVRGRAGHEQDWHCFGCGEGGGIFDLAARLWGLNTRADFSALLQRLTAEILGAGRAAV